MPVNLEKSTYKSAGKLGQSLRTVLFLLVFAAHGFQHLALDQHIASSQSIAVSTAELSFADVATSSHSEHGTEHGFCFECQLLAFVGIALLRAKFSRIRWSLFFSCLSGSLLASFRALGCRVVANGPRAPPHLF